MCALIPTLDAYAAKEAPAFPDESSTNSTHPFSFNICTSLADPRSLKEAVGLKYSNLPNRL